MSCAKRSIVMDFSLAFDQKPGADRPDGVTLPTFQAYLYTVVTTANGTQPWVALRTFQAYLYTVVTIVQPHTVEAELWWNRPTDKDGDRWYYFRRYVDKTVEAAVRRVERNFKVWAESQRAAEGP